MLFSLTYYVIRNKLNNHEDKTITRKGGGVGKDSLLQMMGTAAKSCYNARKTIRKLVKPGFEGFRLTAKLPEFQLKIDKSPAYYFLNQDPSHDEFTSKHLKQAIDF